MYIKYNILIVYFLELTYNYRNDNLNKNVKITAVVQRMMSSKLTYNTKILLLIGNKYNRVIFRLLMIYNIY